MTLSMSEHMKMVGAPGVRRSGRYPTHPSLRQRVDTVQGRLVEDLECGHTVPTPVSFLCTPYTPGIRRICKECYRNEENAPPEPPPECTKSALQLAMGEMELKGLAQPMQAFPIACELSGVYCLLKRSKVMYVGQSRNLLARIGTHVKTYRKQFDSILFSSVPLKNLDRVEGFLIRALRPPLNRVIPEPFIEKEAESHHIPHRQNLGLTVSPDESGGES